MFLTPKYFFHCDPREKKHLIFMVVFLVGLGSGEWAINSQTRNATPMEQNNLTFSPWKVERSSTGQLTITPTSVQTKLKGPKPLLLSYRQPNLPCCLLQHFNRSLKNMTGKAQCSFMTHTQFHLEPESC